MEPGPCAPTSALGWEADVADPPLWGRGTMRSMVEGHARCFLSFIRNAAPPVPLHHLRWPPSPFRGGSSASGRSEEHTSELQSLMRISYAVFCLKTQKHKFNIA